MIKILIYITTVWIILISCNPFINKELRYKKKCNRKLEALIRKCPGLIQPDTIIKIVTIEIPAIDIALLVATNNDVSGVDSIIAKYEGVIDSLLARKIGKEIKWYIRERPCIIDTLKFTRKGIKVEVFQIGKQIFISVEKPKESIKAEIKIEIPRIEKIKLTWGEKLMIFLGKFWIWIVIMGIIAFILAILRKKYKIF